MSQKSLARPPPPTEGQGEGKQFKIWISVECIPSCSLTKGGRGYTPPTAAAIGFSDFHDGCFCSGDGDAGIGGLLQQLMVSLRVSTDGDEGGNRRSLLVVEDAGDGKLL